MGAVPPNLPRGGQLAVISGDASKAGTVYTLRLKMPDGYKFSPHWHPQDVYVTVISGTLGIGMGDKFDETKGELVKRAGYSRAQQDASLCVDPGTDSYPGVRRRTLRNELR